MSFALAIASVFAFSKTAPGGALMGGLGNASQVFIIFLPWTFVIEENAQAGRNQDILLTEYHRDVTA